jgi:hypothetical protein
LILIYLVFADWLIGQGQKVGGYQITLPNPAGGILDRLPCRLLASQLSF